MTKIGRQMWPWPGDATHAFVPAGPLDHCVKCGAPATEVMVFTEVGTDRSVRYPLCPRDAWAARQRIRQVLARRVTGAREG